MNNLFLQSGAPLKISNLYNCKHPTLNDIRELELKDSNLYSEYVSALTSTILDIADVLWVECKVFYEDIQDEWKFFVERSVNTEKTVKICKQYEDGNRSFPEYTYLINDTVRNAFNFFLNTSGEYVLIPEDDIFSVVNISNIENDTYIYNNKNLVLNKINFGIIQNFISKINWINTKDHQVVHGGTKRAKKYILEMEYKARVDDARRAKQNVTLDSIVSSLIAKGTPYKMIWEYPIYMIYDQYHRYIQFDGWTNTNNALCSGNLDTKKNPIKWDKINWSRVLN